MVAPTTISELHQTIRDRLGRGERIRRTLPEYGRLFIDRQLPFLVLYRRPVDEPDQMAEHLITGTAAYLFASAETSFRKDLKQLVVTICDAMREKFGRFLLVEITTRKSVKVSSGNDKKKPPTFRLVLSETAAELDSLTVLLAQQLSQLRLAGRRCEVETVVNAPRQSLRHRPLMSEAEAAALNCSVFTIEIAPIFRSPDDETVYPEVLRALRTGLGRALKKLFFAFAEQYTPMKPRDYHVLGRHAMVKAAWLVDEQLDVASSQFDFLLEVTPINTDAAWLAFRRNGFQKPPLFRYRPLPIDPPLLKRSLYEIPIERIEDPTVAHLFREKQAELDRQITMLGDRGTKRFLLGSEQLYGDVDKGIVRTAEDILERVSATERTEPSGGMLGAEAFAERAEREFNYYRRKWSGFDAEIIITPEIVAGFMVSRGRLLISPRVKTPTNRADALLQHEIGTHLVTYFNGSAQPLRQLRTGLAGYDELQEGLAVLSEFLVGGLTPARLRLLAARVIAARLVTDGASFIDTFRLLSRYGFSQRIAFMIAARIYRGGGLTKDMVYLRGLVAILNYLREGGKLDPLFVGKVSISHLPVMQELQSRGILKPPKLMPRYLTTKMGKERLAYLAGPVAVYELIEKHWRHKQSA